MRKYKSFIFFLFPILAFSQSLKGITREVDVSFSNHSALLSAQERFPEVNLGISAKGKLVKSSYNILYSKLNGISLELDFFEPKTRSTNQLPGIILIHGGGWRSGDRSQHHQMAIELAAQGFVVFTPQYRLSTHALFPAAILDVKYFIQWVKENASSFGLNPNKVALIGYSAGGQMAAFIGATIDHPSYQNIEQKSSENTSVQAVVDIDGILAFLHPDSGEGDDSKRTSAATYYFGYSKEENPELWQEAGALNHVSADAPPFLFINSSVERMHAGRKDFRKILNDHNIHSEVYTFPEAPHVFPLIDKWFEATCILIVDFLTQELK